MTRPTDSIGAYGERVAASALTGAGMVMLDRNWRCASGEFDIVARDGEVIVFCEQKLRELRHWMGGPPRQLRPQTSLARGDPTVGPRWPLPAGQDPGMRTRLSVGSHLAPG
jgi:putative endonuclease